MRNAVSLFAAIGGVPMPQSLMVKVFNHAHKYYSLGIRLYFGTIPGKETSKKRAGDWSCRGAAPRHIPNRTCKCVSTAGGQISNDPIVLHCPASETFRWGNTFAMNIQNRCHHLARNERTLSRLRVAPSLDPTKREQQMSRVLLPATVSRPFFFKHVYCAVFAWIFTAWALLAVTPVYVFMVRGLENAGFVQAEMNEIARLRGAAAVPSSSNSQAAGAISPAAATQRAGDKQHTV